mmetsp:Transcript_100979/g.240638  ORF Transcript_100979/g.240638 Transcript_100979/m.240638 type:complete len:319 (-) Transcript_100979:665-1621(-)
MHVLSLPSVRQPDDGHKQNAEQVEIAESKVNLQRGRLLCVADLPSLSRQVFLDVKQKLPEMRLLDVVPFCSQAQKHLLNLTFRKVLPKLSEPFLNFCQTEVRIAIRVKDLEDGCHVRQRHLAIRWYQHTWLALWWRRYYYLVLAVAGGRHGHSQWIRVVELRFCNGSLLVRRSLVDYCTHLRQCFKLTISFGLDLQQQPHKAVLKDTRQSEQLHHEEEARQPGQVVQLGQPGCNTVLQVEHDQHRDDSDGDSSWRHLPIDEQAGPGNEDKQNGSAYNEHQEGVWSAIQIEVHPDVLVAFAVSSCPKKLGCDLVCCLLQ